LKETALFFETRKIKLETLSEYLREIRESLGLSTEEVAKKTGIGTKPLEALEAGAYNRLPSEVYVKGFLSQLAQIYNIDKQVLINQFEIERKIQKAVTKTTTKPTNAKKGIFQDLVITPKNLSLVGGVAFILVTVVYICWQVFSISKVPDLRIESPQDLTVIDKSFVEILGTTDPGSIVTVNNEPVFVDREGKFSTQLGISSGPKELIIVAKNRFDKSTTKILTIIGQPKTLADNQGAVRLELEFIRDVEVGLRIDGGEKLTQSYKQGTSKVVEAKRQVLLSASDAGAVRVKINGQLLGFLGRQDEKLVDIPFTAQSSER
jgi:cytoskeletal protein RodZ